MAEATLSTGHRLTLQLACIAARCLTPPVFERPVEVMGLHFAAPLSIAAGFDRFGRLGRRAGALGFGCNEIGSLDLAAIAQLSARTLRPGTARLGINLSLTPDISLTALRAGLARAWPLADYLTLNLIGPRSTALLGAELRPRLRQLLAAVRSEQQHLDRPERRVPLAVKLRCLPGQVPLELAELLLELGYDGLLVAHDPGPPATRQRYHAWQTDVRQAQACAQIEQLRRLCGGQMALMSVGGIQSAEHLQARLAAGAELLQVHSVLLHAWPWHVQRLLDGGKPA
ncbi:phosphoserine aminotransferase [Pseudomonas sp. SA3-5]|uniref:Phosphoserine aminotransferase n=1 Tax=Pseudomonas aestuarii TaxID=3018340 RepID=A0ABT4XK36_9PSED|nr:phosphoserine aminotransferase [Pseudomonas aestuarii]MDA7088582.1 phosphoserine aminotransferase [Pseudomonas aestuarii]